MRRHPTRAVAARHRAERASHRVHRSDARRNVPRRRLSVREEIPGQRARRHHGVERRQRKLRKPREKHAAREGFRGDWHDTRGRGPEAKRGDRARATRRDERAEEHQRQRRRRRLPRAVGGRLRRVVERGRSLAVRIDGVGVNIGGVVDGCGCRRGGGRRRGGAGPYALGERGEGEGACAHHESVGPPPVARVRVGRGGRA